jgi:hypothetical protein
MTGCPISLLYNSSVRTTSQTPSFYCCVRVRFRGNMFTEPLLRNGRLFIRLLYSNGSIRHNIYRQRVQQLLNDGWKKGLELKWLWPDRGTVHAFALGTEKNHEKPQLSINIFVDPFRTNVLNTVAYLLRARTETPEKQPLLANGSETTFVYSQRPRNKQRNNVRC